MENSIEVYSTSKNNIERRGYQKIVEEKRILLQENHYEGNIVRKLVMEEFYKETFTKLENLSMYILNSGGIGKNNRDMLERL